MSRDRRQDRRSGLAGQGNLSRALGERDPRLRRGRQYQAGAETTAGPVFLDDEGLVSLRVGDGLGLVAGALTVLVQPPLILQAGSPFAVTLSLGAGLKMHKGRVVPDLRVDRLAHRGQLLTETLRAASKRLKLAEEELKAIEQRSLERAWLAAQECEAAHNLAIQANMPVAAMEFV